MMNGWRGSLPFYFGVNKTVISTHRIIYVKFGKRQQKSLDILMPLKNIIFYSSLRNSILSPQKESTLFVYFFPQANLPALSNKVPLLLQYGPRLPSCVVSSFFVFLLGLSQAIRVNARASTTLRLLDAAYCRSTPVVALRYRN